MRYRIDTIIIEFYVLNYSLLVVCLKIPKTSVIDQRWLRLLTSGSFWWQLIICEWVSLYSHTASATFLFRCLWHLLYGYDFQLLLNAKPVLLKNLMYRETGKCWYFISHRCVIRKVTSNHHIKKSFKKSFKRLFQDEMTLTYKNDVVEYVSFHHNYC